MGNDFNSILLSISGVCFVIVILVIMRVFSRMPSSTSVVIPRKRLKDLEEDNAKKTEALSKSDRVVQELLSDINKLKKELQDVNLKAEEEKKKLEAEIRARDSSISNATIKMDLDSARKEITALQEQLKDRTAAVIQLEEAARSSERLKEELDAFKAKAVAEAPARDEAAEKQSQAETEELNKKLASLQEELVSKSSQLESKDAEIKDLSAKLSESSPKTAEEKPVDTQEIETLKQKIAQLEKENSERVTELQSKEVEIGALNEQMNAMRDQMPQAAVPDDVAQLKQRMTLLEEELNDRLTQIQTQDIEINRLNEELSAAIKGGPIGDAPAALQPGPEDQEISRLNALLNEVDGGKAGGPGLKGLSDQDRARIAELEDALRDRDAKIAHIGKEIDSMRGAITAGEKALKEKEAELASVRDRSGDSGAKITALEKELSAVKASLDKEKEAAVKSVTSELDKIKTEYEKVKAGAEELKAQLEKKDKEAKQLSEELAKEKSERSGKEVDKEEDILKLKRELEGAREETEKLKKQLQERFSDIEKKDKEIADLKESLVSHQESGKTKGKALESSLEELNKELQASKTEVQRLSGELNKKFQDIIFRENELAAVKADLEKEKAKSPAGGASLIANASMKSEMDNIKAELAKYKKAIDEKEAELQAVKGQAAQAPAGESAVTAEFSALAKMVEEEKTVASDIRTYLDENKSKLEMLMDKAKENVDLIAQFSKTKDFEEFRKTLHMDNIIMKYENEIDFLKRKNLDLELKLKARQ